MPRLGARLLRVLVVLVVVQLVALSPLISRPAGAPLADRRAVQARAVAPALVSREAAVRALLATRSRALLQRDRTAWLGTVEPGATAFRERQGALFDSLLALPLTGWTYRLDATGAQPPSSALDARRGVGWWAPQVATSYRLAGWDATPVTSTRPMTFVPRLGRWYLAGDDDLGAADTGEVWDAGPVVAVRRGSVLVLGHPDAGRLLTTVAAAAVDAVPQVTEVWGTRWARQLVVLVPSSQAELRALIGGSGSMSQIAAYATSRAPGVGERIVVNPATFPLLGSVGRRVVLTHEATHVAARTSTGTSTPTWLVEGFADYVGYSGLTLPYDVSAQELRADVRRGRLPSALPGPAAFDGANPSLAAVYEQAWLAVVLIAERHGRATLLRLYRAVGAGEDLDAAMRRLLGTDLRAFTAGWRADLQARLA